MLPWLSPLLHGDGIAGLILVLGIVIAVGIALGSVKIKGISLGIAGVLFSGIIYAHVAWREAPTPAAQPATATVATAPTVVDPALAGPATAAPAAPVAPSAVAPPSGHAGAAASRGHLLEFLREFGLILFVYSIGMQLGPGFFSSLRAQGLRWNLLAASVVMLGGAMGILAWQVGHLPPAVSVGLLSGAVTNTPGLAAATQAMKDSMPHATAADLNLPAMGYAVAYPFGVLGVIMSMIALRLAFKVDPLAEAAAFRASGVGSRPAPTGGDLEVKNPGLAGQTIARAITVAGGGAAVSRLMRGGSVVVADPDQTLQLGDVIHVVGDAATLDRMRMVVGDFATVKLTEIEADLDFRLMLVTNPTAVGRTVGELDLPQRCGATISRINRAGIEFVAAENVRLLFGDQVRVVGGTVALDKASIALGNSVKHLDHPQLIPVFVGIALGVVAGSVPVLFPGIPAPVKLGLAGGPLVVALILSRFGRVGGMNFYLSSGANLMIRELGIVLFLACVGLKAGGTFVDTVVAGDGLRWMAWAAAITIVPVITVGIFARLVLKLNYTALSGLMAGSMTDPPALAFANATTQSESPAVTYATVYPLTMLLRVLSAQAFVLFAL